MKYDLVNKSGDVVFSVDGVNENEAREYFVGLKQVDEEQFDKLWKVVPVAQPKPQRQYQWWVEDKEITDDEMKI